MKPLTIKQIKKMSGRPVCGVLPNKLWHTWYLIDPDGENLTNCFGSKVSVKTVLDENTTKLYKNMPRAVRIYAKTQMSQN